MPTTIKEFPTTDPDIGSLEETEELVRKRAYSYYQQRGCEHGHELDDWLRAEQEIFGTKTTDYEAASEAIADAA